MTQAEKVLHLAEQLRDDTAANLSELVQIPSLSGQEREVNAALMRQMEAAGFDTVELDPLGNVIGKIGNGPRILAIDAHMDTVDVGELGNWDFDPFSGAIKDGHVHGRGSVDQEGGAAAFVNAGRIVQELGLGDQITLVCTGTVMEEDCDGLCWKHLIEESGLRPELVISSEPTSLGVYRGQRGRMEMDVHFTGVSAHGSAPERGENAVYMAARACLSIEELHQRLADDAFLGKGSVAVTQMTSSGPSLCAIPDVAKIHLDRRLTAGETKDSAVAEVIAALGDGPRVEVPYYDGKAYTGLEYGMEMYYPTWVVPEDHPAVIEGATVAEAILGKKPVVDRWTFSTNGIAIMGLHGIPCIGFGPGDEPMAHAPNERVPVDHLVKASAFYALYALRMSGVGE